MNYVDKLYHSSYSEPGLESSSVAAMAAAAGLASSESESSTPRLCPMHRHWTSPQPRAGLGWAPPPAAVASAAVLAQRGLWGVAHTRGESSARIKGATGIRRAEETLFLLYPQAPWWPPRSLPISEEVNLNVYTTWL